MENEYHAGLELGMAWFSGMYLGRIAARIIRKWERNMDLQYEVNMFALYDYFRRFPASIPKNTEQLSAEEQKVSKLRVIRGGRTEPNESQRGQGQQSWK